MKLTLEQINGLQIADDVKAEITGLFNEMTAKQTEVDSLRSKLPKDSQKIVEGVDYDKFVAATTELDRLRKEMESRLTKDGGKKGRFSLAAFAPFFPGESDEESSE